MELHKYSLASPPFLLPFTAKSPIWLNPNIHFFHDSLQAARQTAHVEFIRDILRILFIQAPSPCAPVPFGFL
jgi:hypothetical protein